MFTTNQKQKSSPTKINTTTNNNNNHFPDDEEAIFKATSSEVNFNKVTSKHRINNKIPDEYLYDPFTAEPKLEHLRTVLLQQAEENEKEKKHYKNKHGNNTNNDNSNDDYHHHSPNRSLLSSSSLPLSSPLSSPSNMKKNGLEGEDYNDEEYKTNTKPIVDILTAAENDINEHLARIKAVITQDFSILDSSTNQSSYSRHTDVDFLDKTRRLQNVLLKKDDLQSKSLDILKSLSQNISVVTSTTTSNSTSSSNAPLNVVGTPDSTDTGAGNTGSTDTGYNIENNEKEMSKEDVCEARLNAWEKALEWYIYCPPDKTTTATTAITSGIGTTTTSTNNESLTTATSTTIPSTSSSSSSLLSKQRSKKGLSSSSSSSSNNNNKPSLTLHQLLQHLTVTCIAENDETTNINALEKATQMCLSHLEKTTQLLMDASEHTGLTYEAYAIHLMAHGLVAQRTRNKSEDIQNQYLVHGREALRIGTALEQAESKRRQSDYASLLIRRFWMMENLAEQEELSGEIIKVNEEVRGIIPSSSCRMDPLFTRPEFSLEAAKVLKNLRMVVRCRSTSSNSSNIGSDVDGGLDPHASRRFELTDRLIQRTSAALEQRLLNTFCEIYTAGGAYDFSSIKAANRPGRLDWIELREVAEALMNFDSGRSLHKKYVDLVVSTKFPELFSVDNNLFSPDNKNESSEVGEEMVEFDVDATRSKLSNLFHRVCEVLTDEFKLIAHVFSPILPQHLQEASGNGKTAYPTSFTETYPLQVARSLLQRIISDRYNGMQAQINELLESIDQMGDSASGAKKLDTFVVIHEKATGLFSRLKDAARRMWGPSTFLHNGKAENSTELLISNSSNAQAVASLTQFLSSLEKNLSSGQRRGYFNLELRLLHHDCCMNLDQNGGKLTKPMKPKEEAHRITGWGGLADYRAPIVALDKNHIKEEGFHALLNGPLKQSVSRQPLIHATNALARARLMFGIGSGGGDVVDSTARVVLTIFTQISNFYGQSYLYPILESIAEMISTSPPSTPPTLPFDETTRPHDLGVDGKFWVSIERIHSAAKSFEREMWAENRTGSMRVWEILVHTRSQTSLTLAKERRIRFFQELEERGEAVILRALDALSAHIQWILVAGGESVSKSKSTTGTRLFTGSGGGPYAVPTGTILDSTNSPAVKALTFCLRSQFVKIQAALTPQSLSKFWTSLSKRIFDVVVIRLLQNYTISTVGAVVLSRDVEALRSVSMLAGTDHSHWDTLRELLTLYMTPPDSLKSMLVGVEGDINSGKGLFGRVGKYQSIVFMSRRNDYRYRTNQGMRKSQWVIELLEELNIQQDPTDSRININLYCAENIKERD